LALQIRRLPGHSQAKDSEIGFRKIQFRGFGKVLLKPICGENELFRTSPPQSIDPLHSVSIIVQGDDCAAWQPLHNAVFIRVAERTIKETTLG
jgi:hypothetical protein